MIKDLIREIATAKGMSVDEAAIDKVAADLAVAFLDDELDKEAAQLVPQYIPPPQAANAPLVDIEGARAVPPVAAVTDGAEEDEPEEALKE